MQISLLISSPIFYILLFSLLAQSCSFDSKPNFKSFTDVNQKKQAFFAYFEPLVAKANAAVIKDRQQVQAVDLTTVKSQPKLFKKLCNQYNLDCKKLALSAQRNLLLLHIDIVPPSLALAQSANESAWGTSRFAVKGNNYFGQWCFSKGCGIVPKRRDKGMTHEVRRFKSAYQSVQAYIKNINTSKAYRELRQIRAQIRQSKQPILGTKLVYGLSRYSERGQDYIAEILSMIKTNNLTKYDTN